MNRIDENGSDGVPFDSLSPVAWRPLQWRLKVSRFRPGGFEVTASLVDRERERDRWERFGGFGAPVKRREAGAEPDPDSLRRARQRAKTRVRHLAKNLGVSHLLTLSTRQRANTREEMLGYWARFLRLYERVSGDRLAFIEVLERHPTNREHLHIHAAVTSYLPVGRLRRLWYIALGGKGCEKGSDTPGAVHMREFRAKEAGRRSSRVARYIAKYMTKDAAEEFNKKRYSCSRHAAEGIEVQAQWLDAESKADMLAELLTTFDLSLGSEDLWIASSGRRVWAQVVPGSATDPPPF